MLSLYLMKTVVVIIDRLVCEPTWTLIEVPVSQKSLCQSYSIDFLWNHDVHTRKECILLKKLELLHNLWSFVIERSPGRQIFMVSFWFQGELVFHAPGDQTSYQLFQTFFESLNHSGKENIAFFWKWQEIYLSIAPSTFGSSLCFLFICHWRWRDDLQEKSHCPHLKGFSPVCLRLCIFRSKPFSLMYQSVSLEVTIISR